MQPSKIYEDDVDIDNLTEISKKYMVKATDGKSMVIVQFGKVLIEKGEPLEEKKRMTVALYEACKRMKIKGVEYYVQKMERVVSREIKADLERIAKKYRHIIVEAFSKRARNVVLLYKDGKLKFFEGNGSKLLKEKKAIFDVYSVIESSVTSDSKRKPERKSPTSEGKEPKKRVEESHSLRKDLLQEYRIRDPSEKDVNRIINNAFGD